jgi:hypothetical protein
MAKAKKSDSKKSDSKALETLAKAELEDWFVWDLLATTALEKAGYDRLMAIRLLAQAIAELSTREDAALPRPD